MREELPVLVVGAGPVGLAAATELTRRGVETRLVDKAAQPSPLTKALMVWPRTLDILRQLGGVDHIVDHGLPVDSFRYYSNAKQICRIGFDGITQPVVLPQPDVEDLLRASLKEAGGATEWETRLLGLEQEPDRVHARLRAADGTETVEEFSYVVGCDGAGSTVRDLVGMEFHGATYPNLFLLADTEVRGDLQFDAVHYYCSDRGILVMVPMPNGRFRIFTAGPPTMKPDDLTVPLLQQYVDERGPGGLELHNVGWHTAFSIHARHTDRFREGRVFLAGDAAHIHSPAGGQGLNTGITDANNLAWKLALVHGGRAVPGLLDTYGTERGAVATAVVKQAEWQTKAWLFKKRWQVALRDGSARLAEATGAFDRWYSPWLAGLTNDYPESGAIVGPVPRRGRGRRTDFHAGRLLPNPPVIAPGHPTAVPLREALPSDRYTVLVTVPAGDVLPATVLMTLRSLQSTREGLIHVRVLDGTGALRDPLAIEAPRGTGFRYAGAWQPRRFAAALVRPDHYVAAQDRTPGLPAIREHLTAITEMSVPAAAALQ